jgi:hypothetical protein
MGTPSGGLPAPLDDDVALRRASELAAADWLLKLWPDLDLADRHWRGEPLGRAWTDDGEPPPAVSEPGPADVPGPGSMAAASG